MWLASISYGPDFSPLRICDIDLTILSPVWQAGAPQGMGFAQNLNMEKAQNYTGNDSDDDRVPDELPATFFVADDNS